MGSCPGFFNMRQVIRMPHLIRDGAEGVWKNSILLKVIKPERGEEPEGFFDLEQKKSPLDSSIETRCIRRIIPEGCPVRQPPVVECPPAPVPASRKDARAGYARPYFCFSCCQYGSFISCISPSSMVA